MRFLIDAQLPPSLAKHLVANGHEATHVAEVGLTDASDKTIWSHAVETGAVLITKDEDFVTMRALDNKGPPLVWVRIGNTTKRVLIERFTENLVAILGALQRGDTIIEISDR